MLTSIRVIFLLGRFGAYDVQMRWFRQIVTHKDGSKKPRLAEGTANFVAGGLGSSKLAFHALIILNSTHSYTALFLSDLFWIFAYPFDNVKKYVFYSDNISYLSTNRLCAFAKIWYSTAAWCQIRYHHLNIQHGHRRHVQYGEKEVRKLYIEASYLVYYAPSRR